MSEFLVAVLRIVFLGAIWVFILFAASVVKTDMFGRTVSTNSPELNNLNEPPQKHRGRRRRSPKGLASTLTVIAGRSAGATASLGDTIVIGRASDADIVIDDDYSSTRHARVTGSGNGTWTVQDLTSTNGTYVNGVRITVPTEVSLGDIIRIGRTQLKLES